MEPTSRRSSMPAQAIIFLVLIIGIPIVFAAVFGGKKKDKAPKKVK
jgi:hypothetical protein